MFNLWETTLTASPDASSETYLEEDGSYLTVLIYLPIFKCWQQIVNVSVPPCDPNETTGL